jgi:hypothetical protein
MGQAYFSKGDLLRATEFVQKAAGFLTAMLEADHPDTAIAQRSLNQLQS